MWGAWIETCGYAYLQQEITESHPVWGAWIETAWMQQVLVYGTSHPVWGAWIETRAQARETRPLRVAPRVGCVD